MEDDGHYRPVERTGEGQVRTPIVGYRVRSWLEADPVDCHLAGHEHPETVAMIEPYLHCGDADIPLKGESQRDWIGEIGPTDPLIGGAETLIGQDVIKTHGAIHQLVSGFIEVRHHAGIAGRGSVTQDGKAGLGCHHRGS